MFSKTVSHDKNPYFLKGHKSRGNHGHPHDLMYLKANLHNLQIQNVSFHNNIMFRTAIPPYACTIDFRKLKYSIDDLSTGEKFENGKDN